MGSKNGSRELHAVMFPWFAFGHISPFIQLSNKLFSHGVRVSFLSASGNINRLSPSLNPDIQIIPLKIPPVEGLPLGVENTADGTPAMAELLKKAVDQLQPEIQALLTNLKPHLVIHDFVQHWLPSLVSKLGIKSLFFCVFSAVADSYVQPPSRMGETEFSLEEMKKPPQDYPCSSSLIAGLKTFEAQNLLYVFMKFGGSPGVYERFQACHRDCTGIIYKSCNEMEGAYIDFLRIKLGKPILLTGPLVPKQPPGVLDNKFAKWLGSFPPKSVIFCSFGSETFLSDEQIKELVLGLEQTGLPFVVVLNFPAESEERMKLALPDGFEERVKDKGMVHTGWVQQQHILAHDSVGCQVCHSGLSSIIEAFVNDCQLVLLPMKGDQFLNAKLVGGDQKAGVEVIRNDEDGYFTKDDLCMAVKTVMLNANEEPGKSIRENHDKWRKFMMDNEIQEALFSNFVQELKNMVF